MTTTEMASMVDPDSVEHSLLDAIYQEVTRHGVENFGICWHEHGGVFKAWVCRREGDWVLWTAQGPGPMEAVLTKLCQEVASSFPREAT